MAAPTTFSVLDSIAAPVTEMVLEKNALPTILVLDVLATSVVAVLLPVMVMVENESLALKVVLPVTVSTVLTLTVADVTFIVEALTLKNTPPTFVFPLTGIIETLFAVISTFEKSLLALRTNTFAPPKAKAVFVNRLSVFPVTSDPPPMPENAINVLAPKTPLTYALPDVSEPPAVASAVTAFCVMIVAISLVLANQAPNVSVVKTLATVMAMCYFCPNSCFRRDLISSMSALICSFSSTSLFILIL